MSKSSSAFNIIKKHRRHQKKVCEKYQNASKEEKEKKQEYVANIKQNLLENKK